MFSLLLGFHVEKILKLISRELLFLHQLWVCIGWFSHRFEGKVSMTLRLQETLETPSSESPYARPS